MITSQNLYTITDMRKRADQLLSLAASGKQPIGILKNNRLKAYLIDPQILEALESLVEDVLDQKLVADRLLPAKNNRLHDFDLFWKKHHLPE